MLSEQPAPAVTSAAEILPAAAAYSARPTVAATLFGSFKAQRGGWPRAERAGASAGPRAGTSPPRDTGTRGRPSRGDNSESPRPKLPAPGFSCFLVCISAGVFPPPPESSAGWMTCEKRFFYFFFNFCFLNTLNSPKGILGVAYLQGSVSLVVTSRGKIIGFTR